MQFSCEINPLYSTLADRILTACQQEEGTLIYKDRNKLYQTHIEGIGYVVLKVYARPRLVSRIAYLFRMPKAQKAYRNGLILSALSVKTPEPIACYIEREGQLITRSISVCRMVPNASTVKAAFTASEPSERMIRHVAAFIAQVNQKGCIHKDLSPGNIIYDSTEELVEPTLYLIDINRLIFVHRLTPSFAHRYLVRMCIRNHTAQMLADHYSQIVYASAGGSTVREMSRDIQRRARIYFITRARTKTIKYSGEDNGWLSRETIRIAVWWFRHMLRRYLGRTLIPIRLIDQDLYLQVIAKRDIPGLLQKEYADSVRKKNDEQQQ